VRKQCTLYLKSMVTGLAGICWGENSPGDDATLMTVTLRGCPDTKISNPEDRHKRPMKLGGREHHGPARLSHAYGCQDLR
jgi:hypothetical protein